MINREARMLFAAVRRKDRQRYLLQLRGSEALEAPGEAECSPSHSPSGTRMSHLSELVSLRACDRHKKQPCAPAS